MGLTYANLPECYLVSRGQLDKCDVIGIVLIILFVHIYLGPTWFQNDKRNVIGIVLIMLFLHNYLGPTWFQNDKRNVIGIVLIVFFMQIYLFDDAKGFIIIHCKDSLLPRHDPEMFHFEA